MMPLHRPEQEQRRRQEQQEEVAEEERPRRHGSARDSSRDSILDLWLREVEDAYQHHHYQAAPIGPAVPVPLQAALRAEIAQLFGTPPFANAWYAARDAGERLRGHALSALYAAYEMPPSSSSSSSSSSTTRPLPHPDPREPTAAFSSHAVLARAAALVGVRIWLTEDGRRWPKTQVEQAIAEPLALHTTMRTDDFLRYVHESGLFLELETGEYGFAHLTFQEYLAAVHASTSTSPGAFGLIARIGDSWWEETLRLYCAQVDAMRASAVIEACLPEDEALPNADALALALACLDEAPLVRPETRTRVQEFLDRCVEAPDTERQQIAAEALLAKRLRELVFLGDTTRYSATPITCVEYQLFLDEQQVKGVGTARQPPHWTTARFPPGEGHTPLLGVLPEDAVAFCAWLTERPRSSGRTFRLPRPHEVREQAQTDFRLVRHSAGFWVLDDSGEFTCVKSVASPAAPDYVERLRAQLQADLQAARATIPAALLDQAFHGLLPSLVLDLAIALDHDSTTLASANTSALALTPTLLIACVLHLISMLAIDLVLDLDSDHVLDLDFASALARDLASARDVASDLARASASVSDRASDLARDLARDLDRDVARDLASALDRVLDFASDLARASALDRVRFDISAQVNTLAVMLAHPREAMRSELLASAARRSTAEEQQNGNSWWRRILSRRQRPPHASLPATATLLKLYAALLVLKGRSDGWLQPTEGILLICDLP